MSILLGLSPFATFFALMRLHTPLAGLIGAFAVSSLLCVRMWRRGEAVKILEVGSLVLFGLLTAYTLLAAPRWTVATVRLAVDGGLLAIALVSLAIDRPFTLQYARERVPEQFWGLPIFLTTNRIITAVWAGAFAIHVATDGAAEYVLAIPIWIDVAVAIAAFLGAVWFTRWYPEAVRRRAIASATSAGPAEITRSAASAEH
jgi:hypothetical protein